MERRHLVTPAIIVVAAACLVAGCATMQTTEWKGHTIAKVIKELGPPTQSVPTGGGERMYLWAFQHGSPEGAVYQTTTWCFLVSEEGTVVAWHRDDGATP